MTKNTIHRLNHSPINNQSLINQSHIMKHKYASALAISATLLLAGCATRMSNDPTAPTGPPAATLRVKEFQASYYGSASTGKGTLRYHGRDRSFSITGIGAGGTGAQKISAVGKVYHLNSLADFPGTYTGARSGLTLIEGKMHERLANGNGTVIYLTGETSGLSTSMGLDKIVITLD